MAGFLLVPFLVPGFREDAGQRTLHLLVELAEERLAMLDHIVVVLEHQLALNSEILGHQRELVALPHFLEQRNGLVELLLEIVHVSFVVGAGNRIL